MVQKGLQTRIGEWRRVGWLATHDQGTRMKDITRNSAGYKLARQLWMTRFEMALIVYRPEAAVGIDWNTARLLYEADYPEQSAVPRYCELLEPA
jgi:hypothetical protein